MANRARFETKKKSDVCVCVLVCVQYFSMFVCVSIFYALSICLLRTTPKSSRRNGEQTNLWPVAWRSSTWHWHWHWCWDWPHEHHPPLVAYYCWRTDTSMCCRLLPACRPVASTPFRFAFSPLPSQLLLSKFMIIALPSILRAADSIRLSPNGGGTRCCCCCWCCSSAGAVLQLAVGEGEKPSDSAVIKIGFCAQLNHIFAFNWRLDSRVLT